jgi:predicted lipoprotein
MMFPEIDCMTTEQAKMFLEPVVIEAYRRWRDAEELDLACKAMCKAEYEAVRAEYDAL